MKQDNEQKVQSGPIARFASWVNRKFDEQVDRLVELRAFDERRYDYTKSGK